MTRTRVAPLWAVGLMVAAVVAPGAAHVRRSATMTNLDTTPSVNSAEQRLKALGIELPMPPEPFGTYAEAVQTGNLLFLTGMLPTEGRRATFTDRIGAEIDVEGGRKAARLAADRKSTRLNSSHSQISYAVFCLKKKIKRQVSTDTT